MIAIENTNVFVTNTFPDAKADDSSGPATADGFEFIAAYIDNSVIGPQQAIMDYAGLTPNGVTEAAGASQMISALQLGNAIGPGWVQRRDIFDDPSVHGDRSLLLTEQGVLFAAYPELDAAVYVGDGNSVAVAAAGGYYYHSLNADGTTPNTAGPYLQLPPNPSPVGLKIYTGALTGADFDVTASRPNLAINHCTAIPYQTVDGTWRLIFNYWVTTDTNINNNTIFSGVVFDNESAIAAAEIGAGNAIGFTNNGTGGSVIHKTGTSVNWLGSGDVKLTSIPTWAKVFDIKHAITY